jgi:hypothetical protein
MTAGLIGEKLQHRGLSLLGHDELFLWGGDELV